MVISWKIIFSRFIIPSLLKICDFEKKYENILIIQINLSRFRRTKLSLIPNKFWKFIINKIYFYCRGQLSTTRNKILFLTRTISWFPCGSTIACMSVWGRDRLFQLCFIFWILRLQEGCLPHFFRHSKPSGRASRTWHFYVDCLLRVGEP